jgi:hypothetical protein
MHAFEDFKTLDIILKDTHVMERPDSQLLHLLNLISLFLCCCFKYPLLFYDIPYIIPTYALNYYKLLQVIINYYTLFYLKVS